MEIKVLGSRGCSACSGLEQTVFNALAEIGLVADVNTIEDEKEILRYGIVALPGLVINDQVRVSGRVPAKAEIVVLLKEAMGR